MARGSAAAHAPGHGGLVIALVDAPIAAAPLHRARSVASGSAAALAARSACWGSWCDVFRAIATRASQELRMTRAIRSELLYGPGLAALNGFDSNGSNGMDPRLAATVTVLRTALASWSDPFLAA